MAKGRVVYKSANFDRNLDSDAMEKQIKKNIVKAEEILYQTSNNIAPFDPLRKPASGPHLRQNTEKDIGELEVTRTWLADYSYIRYHKNGKNPQTTYWIQKGYKKKKSVINNIIKKEVLE